MKKKLLLLLSILLSIAFFSTLFTKTTIEKAREKYSKTLKEHPYNKTLKLSKEERKAKAIPPNKYYEEKYLLEINPYTGRTHPENLARLQEKLKNERFARRTPGDAKDNKWVERGPNNVGGRTRVVMFDPNDTTHKRVFAGGVSGGLWVNNDITDANSSWSQVGIDENLAITCMAVDPNNSQIMYIGTGELYTNNHALGNGIWKSTDGGATWVNVYKIRGAITIVNNQYRLPGTYYTTDIIVRDADGSSATSNDSEVFIGIGANLNAISPLPTFLGIDDYGIFKSTNGGINWNRIRLNPPKSNPLFPWYIPPPGIIEAPNDFEVGIDNTLWVSTTATIHGTVGGEIYSSTDGSTFTLKHRVTNGKRTEIEVSKQNANTVYVLAETNPVSILKTTDAFTTLSATITLPNDADTGIPANDFTRGQAFYNLMLAVDPTNDAIAYVGGIDLFRTTNGGASWTQISKWADHNNLAALNIPTVHPDHHGWAFHPTDANIAVNGNDGGVFYASSLSAASSSSTAISARNKNYNITQFYKGAISQTTDPEYLLAGAQDNGTQLATSTNTPGVNSTIEALAGDGAYCFIDKDNEYIIASYVYNDYIMRYDLPYTGTGNRVTVFISLGLDSKEGSFINPMDLDDNLDILYSNGTNKLLRYTGIKNQIPILRAFRNDLFNNITALKVSPYTTTSSKVFVGTSAGTLAKVENLDTATPNTNPPTVTNISGPSFLGAISSIEFGANENEILVSFHNFGVVSVWYTSDGGTNWSNKEGDLPDIPVKCILRNPLNTNEVIIGTDFGVWKTTNFNTSAPSWTHSYNGMSSVPVSSFSLRTVDNTVLASTFGRGMFTAKFTSNNFKWTGATNSDWDTASNWENNITPKALDNVSIPTGLANYPTAANAITVKSIDIKSGATFIANSSVSAEVTYSRNLPTNNWYLVSPAVKGEKVTDFLKANLLAKSVSSIGVNQRIGLANYDNTQINGTVWNYYKIGDYDGLNTNDTSDNMISGKGFSIKVAASKKVSFKGVINTGNITRSISTAANPFNLVGNPYTSFIDANSFLTSNGVNIEKTIWVWNQATSSYDAKNLTSSYKIAPAQGFFVKRKTGNTVLFEQSTQSHEAQGTFQKTVKKLEIELLLTDGTTKKLTEIYYKTNATNGFDAGYDSELFNGVANDFAIYSHLVSDNVRKNYQIQSLPDTNLDEIVIPLGIKAVIGPITFILKACSLPNNYNVFLEDRLKGTFTRLEKTISNYKVTLTAALKGENEVGRFFIHTTKRVLGVKELTLSKISVYSSNQKIHFLGLPEGKITITLYDLLGKTVLKQNIKKGTPFINVDNLPKNVYIIDLKTEKQRINKKIVIK